MADTPFTRDIPLGKVGFTNGFQLYIHGSAFTKVKKSTYVPLLAVTRPTLNEMFQFTNPKLFISYIIVPATRRRRDINIPLCLSAPMQKSLIQ